MPSLFFKLEDIEFCEAQYGLRKTEDKPEPDTKTQPSATEQDPEEFIRKLRVSYENDSQIKIQLPGRRAECFTCESLGFRDNKTKTWKDLTNILQCRPPTYSLGPAYKHYFVDSYSEIPSEELENEKNAAKYAAKGPRNTSYDKRLKRLVEINKKLKKFFQTQHSLEFPENYKLYERCETEKSGTYTRRRNICVGCPLRRN